MKRLILLLCAAVMISFASAQTNGHVQHMTKKDFLSKVMNFEKNPQQWIFLGDKPCLIDFYTTWCGPCKKLAPIMEELAKEYNGKINIYKVDIEREPELARLFGITSIPTLLFCPMNGNPTINKGFLPKETLIKAIEDILLNNSSKETTK